MNPTTQEAQQLEIQELLNQHALMLTHQQNVQSHMQSLQALPMPKERQANRTRREPKKEMNTKSIANNRHFLFYSAKCLASVSAELGIPLMLNSKEAKDQNYHSERSLHAELGKCAEKLQPKP